MIERREERLNPQLLAIVVHIDHHITTSNVRHAGPYELHHCVVIFFWSSGIMECTCMLFTFENRVPLMRQGASVVWHHSLLQMNGFNKTEAAVFSCRLCFLRAFPFISLIHVHTYGYSMKALCPNTRLNESSRQ